MLATLPLSIPDQKGNGILHIVHKIKLALKRLDEDEGGMTTVEAIILLFVAAVVLVVFFTFFWDYIKTQFMTALENLFSQSGMSS